MNPVKCLVFVLMCLACLVPAFAQAQAQGSQDLGPSAQAQGTCGQGKGMERLKTELGLTDDQCSQMKALFNERREARKEKMEATQKQIKAILTPEQQKTWDDKISEIKSNGAGKGSMKGGGGPGQMLRDLNLSDDQKSQVKSIMSAQRSTMQAQREEMDKKLQTILTPDQYQSFTSKMKAMKEQGGNRGFRGGHGGAGQTP